MEDASDSLRPAVLVVDDEPTIGEVLARYQAIMHARLHSLLVHLTPSQKKRLLAAMRDMAAMLDADAQSRADRDKKGTA